jgi:hypothetical protein
LGTGPEPAGKAFNYLNLRSDTPDISPHKAGGDLDLDAGPYAHVITGLIKQSGSTGSEAWMHYVVAILLVLEGEDLFTDDGSDETGNDLQDFQNPENEG